MTQYSNTELLNSRRETKRLKSLVYNMDKPRNFTYMDVSILISLLDKLDHYINEDIEKSRKEVLKNVN